LCGILYAITVGLGSGKPGWMPDAVYTVVAAVIHALPRVGDALPFLHTGVSGYIAGAMLFAALALVLASRAQKKVM
jgi:cell division protein FtsW (lipid II flippase)